MCGRYTVFTEEEIIEMNAIVAEVSRKFGSDAVVTGEIFPTNKAPILTLEDGRLVPAPLSWGFPKWNGKGVHINARSETAVNPKLAETPALEKWIRKNFTKPLFSRRCVVPSTGFFEWTLEAGKSPPGKSKKVKLYFRLPDEPMLYMAGIIDTFVDENSGVWDAFCILTTEAAHTMARFHERMPVILMPQEREDWISNDTFMREVLARKGPDLEWKCAL